MWNENVSFVAKLARPKPGARFDQNSQLVRDLETSVEEANSEWNGERKFEILGYDGAAVSMVYRALDPIRGRRTVTRFLQKISKDLAYHRGWNDKVTRKEGTIFTVEFSIGESESSQTKLDSVDENGSLEETLQAILKVLEEIRDELITK